MKLDKYFREFDYRYKIFLRFLNGEKSHYKDSDLTRMFYEREFVSILRSIVGEDEEALLDFQKLTYRFYIPYLLSLLPKGVNIEYSEDSFSPYIFFVYKNYTIAWHDIYECEFHALLPQGRAEIQVRSQNLIDQINELNELKKDILEQADPRSHHGSDKIPYLVGQKKRLKQLSKDLGVINQKTNTLVSENNQLIAAGNIIDEVYSEFLDIQSQLYKIMSKNFHCELVIEEEDMSEVEDERALSLFSF